MGLFDFVRDLFSRKPVYDPERATVVVFNHLSPEMKDGLDHSDIEKILNFEFRYLDEQGITGDGPSPGEPQTIEQEALVAYIKRKAEQRLLEYTEQQIEAVLAGEVEYMREVGIIED
jgi:hypothetical protein